MGRAYQNRKESMAKTAAAKTKVYSKYGREIYMSAKSGGPDPQANLSLRGLIERAKKDQVPSHVIEKAIDKAKGPITRTAPLAMCVWPSPKPSARSERPVRCLTCSTTALSLRSRARMKRPFSRR